MQISSAHAGKKNLAKKRKKHETRRQETQIFPNISLKGRAFVKIPDYFFDFGILVLSG